MQAIVIVYLCRCIYFLFLIQRTYNFTKNFCTCIYNFCRYKRVNDVHNIVAIASWLKDYNMTIAN